ncbi:MAG TPA: OmpA family protein [Williamwhitmania sp.]|nr:OmpA family protein [Williamwhitmania sp.]
MKKISFVIALALMTTAAFCQTGIKESPAHIAYFETNKAILSEEEIGNLNEFVRDFNSKKETLFRINLIGYTDSTGSKEYNLELSRKRAEAVRSYFVSIGVKPRYIFLEYYGSEKAIKTNTTEEGRALNRRVEIYFNSSSENMLKDSTVKELFKRLAPKEQKFQISSDLGGEIIGKHGTKIIIQPNTFTDSDNKAVNANVQVTLREFYDPAAMVLGNLNTLTTDGKTLTTAGMIEVRATSKGKYLRINQPYSVTFKTQPTNEKMKLFYGIPNSKTKQIYWQDADSIDKEIIFTNQGLRYVSKSQIKYISDSSFNKLLLSAKPRYKDANDSLLQQYRTFQASRFGYINCDAFATGERIEFTFNKSEFENKDYGISLIFVGKVKGVMNLTSSYDPVMLTPMIPENTTAYVVMVLLENNQIKTDVQKIIIKKSNQLTFKPTLTSVTDFKKLLNDVSF